MKTIIPKRFLTCICLTAMAYAEIIGGYTTDYLDYGIGARVLAMGGAGRSIANDATAGYWNSAVLPTVIESNFSGMSASLMGLTKYNQYAISTPLSEKEVMAISYQGLAVENMELHGLNGGDPNATPDGYFSAAKDSIMLSYGRRENEIMNVGITAKYGKRRVYSSEDGVLALDVGFLLDMGQYKIGGNIRNLVSVILGNTDDQYQLDVDVGANIRIEKLLISFDLARFMRKTLSYYVGVEYDVIRVNNMFSTKLRGGINANELTFGVGFETTPLLFDYALLIRPESQDHIFSMSLFFDDNDTRKESIDQRKWYSSVLQTIEERDFAAAHRLTCAGLRQYPDSVSLQLVEKRLRTALQFLAEDTTHDKLFINAIAYYVKEGWTNALDLAEYLAQKYKNEGVYKFRTMIEQEAKRVSKYKGKDILNVFSTDAMKYQRVNAVPK